MYVNANMIWDFVFGFSNPILYYALNCYLGNFPYSSTPKTQSLNIFSQKTGLEFYLLFFPTVLEKIPTEFELIGQNLTKHATSRE